MPVLLSDCLSRTPNELRTRFDQGYKLMVAVDTSDPAYETAADAYVHDLLPASRLGDAISPRERAR